MPRSPQPPPPPVVEMFGARGTPVNLPGGQGGAWRAGDLMLRLAPPVRAKNGSLSVDGWAAWAFLPGEPTVSRWHEVIAAGESFHQAMTRVPRPAFLDGRTDRWFVADQIA